MSSIKPEVKKKTRYGFPQKHSLFLVVAGLILGATLSGLVAMAYSQITANVDSVSVSGTTNANIVLWSGTESNYGACAIAPGNVSATCPNASVQAGQTMQLAFKLFNPDIVAVNAAATITSSNSTAVLAGPSVKATIQPDSFATLTLSYTGENAGTVSLSIIILCIAT